MALLNPTEATIPTLRGEPKTFVIGTWPAVAGLAIQAKAAGSLIELLKDSDKAVAVAADISKHIGVYVGDGDQRRLLLLDSQVMIDNHVPDSDCYRLLIAEAVRYNVGPFSRGVMSGLAEQVISASRPWLTKMSTQLSGFLSKLGSPPSTS